MDLAVGDDGGDRVERRPDAEGAIVVEAEVAVAAVGILP
jgi:hypothetical protein